LLSLIHPTRILGTRPRVGVTIALAPGSPVDTGEKVLTEAASALGERPSATLVHADADGLVYRVAVSVTADTAAADVRAALVKALAASSLSLGSHRTAGRA
jgi:hypothetical protein